jgi:2-polyprenyl-6-methoxyphenol hydroxylase-like FAD-dependent oxidoreductase
MTARSLQSDVLVVGGGPAGATCAAICAAGGKKVTLLERSVFPREKVCGDCLNPGCWDVFDRLGVSSQLLALPHAVLTQLEFVDSSGRSQLFSMPSTGRSEIAVKRSALDHLLLQKAKANGATVHEAATVTSIQTDGSREASWQVTAGTETYRAGIVVAADGRNSTIARLLQILPPAAKDRIGLQTHFLCH